MTVAVIRVIIRDRSGVISWYRWICIECIAHEIMSGEDAAACAKTSAEIGMIVVNAGIHDCYFDACSREAKLRLCSISAGHGKRSKKFWICCISLGDADQG